MQIKLYSIICGHYVRHSTQDIKYTTSARNMSDFPSYGISMCWSLRPICQNDTAAAIRLRVRAFALKCAKYIMEGVAAHEAAQK